VHRRCWEGPNSFHPFLAPWSLTLPWKVQGWREAELLDYQWEKVRLRPCLWHEKTKKTMVGVAFWSFCPLSRPFGSFRSFGRCLSTTSGLINNRNWLHNQKLHSPETVSEGKTAPNNWFTLFKFTSLFTFCFTFCTFLNRHGLKIGHPSADPMGATNQQISSLSNPPYRGIAFRHGHDGLSGSACLAAAAASTGPPHGGTCHLEPWKTLVAAWVSVQKSPDSGVFSTFYRLFPQWFNMF
jgi:hypothetical protein